MTGACSKIDVHRQKVGDSQINTNIRLGLIISRSYYSLFSVVRDQSPSNAATASS